MNPQWRALTVAEDEVLERDSVGDFLFRVLDVFVLVGRCLGPALKLFEKALSPVTLHWFKIWSEMLQNFSFYLL